MASLKSRFLGSWLGDRVLRDADVVDVTTVGAFALTVMSMGFGSGSGTLACVPPQNRS